ncbi:hypothetical protein N431DRAFT_552244 [Stipitochalara longipes BDJ]|nr:hypothetical protein N431DRAFT_552244 [Stipitochalara longipes BDJ]
MDPLTAIGAFASIWQIAQGALSLSKTLYTFGVAMGSASEDIQILADDLGTFSQSLTLLSRLLEDGKSCYLDDIYLLTAKIIKDCGALYVKIDKILEKLGSKRKSTWKLRVKFVYKESQIRKLLDRLRDMKGTLATILAALQVDLTLTIWNVSSTSKIQRPPGIPLQPETLRTLEEAQKSIMTGGILTKYTIYSEKLVHISEKGVYISTTHSESQQSGLPGAFSDLPTVVSSTSNSPEHLNYHDPSMNLFNTTGKFVALPPNISNLPEVVKLDPNPKSVARYADEITQSPGSISQLQENNLSASQSLKSSSSVDSFKSAMSFQEHDLEVARKVLSSLIESRISETDKDLYAAAQRLKSSLNEGSTKIDHFHISYFKQHGQTYLELFDTTPSHNIQSIGSKLMESIVIKLHEYSAENEELCASQFDDLSESSKDISLLALHHLSLLASNLAFGARPLSNFTANYVDFTPTVAAGFQDTGFNPRNWRSVSPPQKDEPENVSRLSKERSSYLMQGNQEDDIIPSGAFEIIEEPEIYFELPTKKSKKKSKKGLSRVDEYEEEIFRDIRKISVPTDAFDDLRNDDDHWDESKKSRRSARDDYDDSRSVVSALAEDNFEDLKRRKKSKKGKKGGDGFFGLFGPKSDIGAGDENPKESKDDFEESEKKKSKKSSVADSSSVYGNAGVQFEGDLSRSMSNRNGDNNGTCDDQDEDNGDDYSEKRKTRSRSESLSSKKDSFLSNGGTLGAGVGLAGAAVAFAAQQYQQSKAANNNEAVEHFCSMSAKELVAREEILDLEIAKQQFRPSIDPQYGDLLPLPPSDSASPNVVLPENLPELPKSRPNTPDVEYIPRTKSLSSSGSDIKDPFKSGVSKDKPLLPEETREFASGRILWSKKGKKKGKLKSAWEPEDTTEEITSGLSSFVRDKPLASRDVQEYAASEEPTVEPAPVHDQKNEPAKKYFEEAEPINAPQDEFAYFKSKKDKKKDRKKGKSSSSWELEPEPQLDEPIVSEALSEQVEDPVQKLATPAVKAENEKGPDVADTEVAKNDTESETSKPSLIILPFHPAPSALEVDTNDEHIELAWTYPALSLTQTSKLWWQAYISFISPSSSESHVFTTIKNGLESELGILASRHFPDDVICRRISKNIRKLSTSLHHDKPQLAAILDIRSNILRILTTIDVQLGLDIAALGWSCVFVLLSFYENIIATSSTTISIIFLETSLSHLQIIVAVIARYAVMENLYQQTNGALLLKPEYRSALISLCSTILEYFAVAFKCAENELVGLVEETRAREDTQNDAFLMRSRYQEELQECAFLVELVKQKDAACQTFRIVVEKKGESSSEDESESESDKAEMENIGDED